MARSKGENIAMGRSEEGLSSYCIMVTEIVECCKDGCIFTVRKPANRRLPRDLEDYMNSTMIRMMDGLPAYLRSLADKLEKS